MGILYTHLKAQFTAGRSPPLNRVDNHIHRCTHRTLSALGVYRVGFQFDAIPSCHSRIHHNSTHTHELPTLSLVNRSFPFLYTLHSFLFCAAMPSRTGATTLRPQLLRCWYCGNPIIPSRHGEPKHPHWEPKQPLRRLLLPRYPNDPDHGVQPAYFHANCEAGLYPSPLHVGLISVYYIAIIGRAHVG